MITSEKLQQAKEKITLPAVYWIMFISKIIMR